MEFLKQNWWIVLIGVAGLLLIRGRSSGGVTQIPGSDTAQLAAIASAERAQDEQNRVGLIGTFLSFINADKDRLRAANSENANINAQVRIAQINADAATTSAQYQNANYTAGVNAQLQQAQLQANLELQALAYANAANRRQSRNTNLNSILQTILGGFNTIYSGGGFGGGGFRIPSIGIGGTANTFPFNF